MTYLKKINALLLVAILALSVFVSPLAALAQSEEIVAKVNGVAITRQQFIDLLEAEFGHFVLQELIQRELVRQKAEQLQVTVDEAEFAETYEMVVAQVGGSAALQLMLMQNGLTEEMFKDQIRFSMLASALTQAEVQASEEDLRKFFEENRAYYDQPLAVEVSHILVETEEQARDLLAQLEQGADLAALAQEHSLDPGTAPYGGYLGMITEGLTVPEFETVAFSLTEGAYGLAESVYGWHVITVHSKQEAKAADYAEIADQVEYDYRRTKALDLQSYLYRLEQEAELEVIWQPK